MSIINISKRLAKKISYGNKRELKTVKYKVIHYTGNKGDTAKNNADYFAASNTREAGAHYFIDKSGEIWESVPPEYTAWAVGGGKQSSSGGTYYGKCTNANSISIELCDCIDNVSWNQLVALRKLCKYIDAICPNAKSVIRHWDVNGKSCPAPMTGTNNVKWKHLHNYVTKGYQYKAKVAKDVAIRSSAKIAPNNKLGSKKAGEVVYITKVSKNGKWGRLKKKTPDGKRQWVYLKKVAEV